MYTMKRFAYRKTYHSPCTARAGLNANSVRVFGRRQFEDVSGPCAFLGKGKTPKKSQKMERQSPAFGNESGNPQNKNEWPLWSPHKVYWLIDDLVYYSVKAGYQKVNEIAKRLGKKKPVGRWVAATGAFVLGDILPAITIANPNGGYEWGGPNSEKLQAHLAMVGLFALIAKTGEVLKSWEEAVEGNTLSVMNISMRITRFPVLIGAATVGAGALFSENPLSWLRLASTHLGIAALLYILSDENGTGKKVKAALGEWMEKSRAGLAEKI